MLSAMCVPRGSAFACFGAAAAFSSLGVGRGRPGLPSAAEALPCLVVLVLSLRSPFRSSWSRLRASFQVVVVEAAGALLCLVLVLSLRPLRLPPGVRSSVGPVFLLECLLSAGMEQPKKEKPVKFVYYIDGHQAGAGGCRAAGDVACAEVFIDELWWRRLSPEEPGPWLS